MVEIEKQRKKKGRPSKADLAARASSDHVTSDHVGVSPSSAAAAAEEAREVRRSLRRKTFRYNIIDYDEDYLDDHLLSEEEDGNEDDGRRKKVKLVVKLSNACRAGGRHRRRFGGGGRVELESEEEREAVKRRVDDEEEEEDEGVEEEEDEDDEGRDGKEEEEEEAMGAGFVSGVSNVRVDYDGKTPMPDDIKQLELILDKLQKKDTYGVYAEPVDPEELPDYHEVVDNPMDFSTVRKKLANGSYSTLEQFESDVFLISSNAMQYNAPETIYHKQARAIKELAERKFQRIRMQIGRIEKEPKSEPKCEPKTELNSEQKERSHSLIKKQTKKLLYRGTHEAVGSDFSSGGTLATIDTPNIGGIDYVNNFERPNNNDGPVEGISSLSDSNLEKIEDPLSGKGILPKFGRRSFVVDENRRATYNISTHPEDRPESIFTTFEGGTKQLIPVGLSGEFSYARSLARFAANLGPMAWGITSKRIEQALPPGFKHGRGWIGEYESLPTTMLVVEHRKDPFASRLHNVVGRKDDKKDQLVSSLNNAIDSRKADKPLEGQAPGNVHLLKQPSSDGKFTMFGSGVAKPPASTVSVSQQQTPVTRVSQHVMFKEAESNHPSMNCQPSNAVLHQQSRFLRDSFCPENMGAKRVEPNSPSISNQKRYYFPQKQLPHGIEIGRKRVELHSDPTSDKKTDNVPQKSLYMENLNSMPNESSSKGKNFLQSLPVRQPDTNRGAPDLLSNGKENNFIGGNRVISSSPGLMSPQLAGAVVSSPPKQSQDQGLSDPVLVMKMMTEKSQKLLNVSVHPQIPAQAKPHVSSPRGDTGGNAAAAAASAWMSVGSAGFRPTAQNSATNRTQISNDSAYNATRMFYPQAMQPHVEYPVSSAMHFQPEKMGLPFQAFASQPMKVVNEAQVPSRPMVFPQLLAKDLSRFQVQTPWRGLSPHTQQKQKQDTLPPDLNVAFQSSVDSQQPDLALQL